MKKILIITLSLFYSITAFAQLTKEERLKDSVVGWFDKFNPADKPLKPVTYGTETFSIKEQQNNNLFVQWIQQSYTPVATTGRFSKNYYVKKGEYFPHSYGVQFRIYNVNYNFLDKQGHFTPIPEEWIPVYINVNSVSYAQAIYFLNTDTEYYFTLPEEYAAENNQTLANMGKADPKVHPNVYKYLTSTANYWQTVYLTPGNKLPIIKLTKGEYLTLAENSIDRYLAKRKREIEQANPNDAKGVAYLYNAEVANTDKYRIAIKKLKAQHQADWNQPALLNTTQPALNSLDGGIDPFEQDQFAKIHHTGGYVYKYDPPFYATARGDKPGFIAITFQYKTTENGNGHYELYRAMTEQLNYDYIYNYFFAADKVKGQPYQPNNAVEWKARLDRYRNSNKKEVAAKVKATARLSGDIVFADDFSQNPAGAAPTGWFVKNTGNRSVVATPPGSGGKWLDVGYNSPVYPINFRQLPENFSLEYDILTSGFTGRTGGAIWLELQGKNAKQSSYVRLQITAGNQADLDAASNYRGNTRIEIYNTPSQMDYNNQGGEATIASGEFTSTKKLVHVKLQKKGANITVYLNGKPITTSTEFKSKYGKPCGDCQIVPSLQYTRISFENRSQDGDTKVYLSNVKVTKE